MRFSLKMAVLASALSIVSVAQAAVIDFNGLRPAGGGYGRVYGAYQEDGYTLTAAKCEVSKQGANCFTTPQAFQSSDSTGASIITQYASTLSTLTKSDGGLFTISSIDVAEYWNSETAASVVFSFLFADGTTGSQTRTINTIGRYPVNTLTFDVGPLKSFGFLASTGSSGSLQFDNIVVNAVSAAPEPATWAMLITGFGMAGASLRTRRRRESVAVA